MLQMGFPAESWSGRYVGELRASVAKQVERGLTGRSGGTWSTEDIPAEERAREFLAWDWANERGYSYRVEVLDPVIGRRYHYKTDDYKLEIHWHRILPWLGDRVRELGMRWRIIRDHVLRVRNPYSR